jgi:hypothetical protein
MQDSAIHSLELVPIKFKSGLYLIKFHLLSENTWERERKDVGVILEAKAASILALLMMLQCACPHSNVLALSNEPKLHVENLAEPDLIALVNYPDLAGVLVDLEHLGYFHLQIKIVVSTSVPFLPMLGNF